MFDCVIMRRGWGSALVLCDSGTKRYTFRSLLQIIIKAENFSSAFDFLQFTVHGSLSAVTHAPFHASMLRPALQAGPMHESAGVGKLVNAALLSLINEACVDVCCATLLSSELVGPACVQTRSSNPRGRACRPNGKGAEEEGY